MKKLEKNMQGNKIFGIVEENENKKGKTKAFCCSLKRCFNLKISVQYRETFVAEINRLVPLFSILQHETSLCANWIFRKHSQDPTLYPLVFNVKEAQNFYRSCISSVLGREVGTKQKSNHKQTIKKKKQEEKDGKWDEKKQAKLELYTLKHKMNQWLNKCKWVSAYPTLSKELKSYSSQFDVIAKQMSTNCLTLLIKNLRNRQ